MTRNRGIKEIRTIIKKKDTLVAPLQRVHVNEPVVLKWDAYCQVFCSVQSTSSTESYGDRIFSTVIILFLSFIVITNFTSFTFYN
jgi:hypothetical protein